MLYMYICTSAPPTPSDRRRGVEEEREKKRE
jgi:hypothetical protein